MGHHPGDREADRRAASGGIVAVFPAGILADGRPTDLVEGDGLGVLAGRAGQRDRRGNLVGEIDHPLEHLHPAHRPADHGGQAVHAEVGHQPLLGAHHVSDGDKRKVQAVAVPRGRVEAGRPGRATATTQAVGAEHCETAGIQRFTRPNDVIPPAGLAVGQPMNPRSMMVPRQSVADQNQVIPCGVEVPVKFIAQCKAGQHRAVVAAKRL